MTVRKLLPRAPANYDSRVDGCDCPGDLSLSDLPVDMLRKRLSAIPGCALINVGAGVNARGDACHNYKARCPHHADSTPSLSIQEITSPGPRYRRVFVYCHAGCDGEDVLASLGLSFRHLYATDYALKMEAKRAGIKTSGSLLPAAPYVPAAATVPEIDYDRLKSLFSAHRRRANRNAVLREFAASFGVGLHALQLLGAGADEDGNLALAERDDRGRVVGIVYRPREGERWCEKGSKRGLTIPQLQPDRGKRLYIPEGASDVAALLHVGANALGRPMAKSSALAQQWLIAYLEKRYLPKHPDAEIIVLGDRDKSGTGQIAAKELAGMLTASLGREVKWALPKTGHKDIREQIVAGAWPGLRWPFPRPEK